MIHRFSQVFPLKVAFWLKASADDFRFLSLASDQIDHADFAPAVDELLRIVRQKPSLFLDSFRINLIPGNDPFAIAAAELSRRYPDELGIRLGSQTLGGTFIADASIDRSPLAVGFCRSVA